MQKIISFIVSMVLTAIFGYAIYAGVNGNRNMENVGVFLVWFLFIPNCLNFIVLQNIDATIKALKNTSSLEVCIKIISHVAIVGYMVYFGWTATAIASLLNITFYSIAVDISRKQGAEND